MRDQWNAEVKQGDAEGTLNYYDKSAHYSYELMWWHSLVQDQGPLAYVVALHLALHNGFKDSLDFGSGVGSGGLLFAKHGFSITLADVSSTLLDFSRRRLGARGISATFIDLKTSELPVANMISSQPWMFSNISPNPRKRLSLSRGLASRRHPFRPL